MVKHRESSAVRADENPSVGSGTATAELDRRNGNGETHAHWIGTALAYVPHVARRYIGCGLPFDELVAAGNLGLVEAALRYQPDRNVKFVTYADWWIRKSIFKALEEQSGPVRLPRYRQEQIRTLKESQRALRRRNGADPDSEQLAGMTGLTREEVDRLRSLGQTPVSLDEPSLPGGDRPLVDVLAVDGSDGPQDTVIRSDLVRHIRGLVATLEGKEREVIALRFGLSGPEPMTLRAIGRQLGISRERVRQIERRALIHLRNYL
jgi:RNA polymerase primary sigma factor